MVDNSASTDVTSARLSSLLVAGSCAEESCEINSASTNTILTCKNSKYSYHGTTCEANC